ncbi:aldo/keto reductase [Ruegeria pomeroyi]|jgi:aryl-alcohol dehydrogenase-like predicted oxidoreductase|uniref:Oxidoreductase, aldo/keto reductase family n=2 Tax=Ruegeria pomeroyi TaxID=89184 RepID=Q5LTI1_RUEPO|nr:aldo/keto reductase [Ruegeria pomeroyi]AAV94720.1 oxidoreductase, aldo/keto reductase family [Ruegeria pomeroyi DSS-3]NVK95850.1 aldo/keto reductase [Ruegeria pomeroyi]NVL00171.1 aldo/keto reductase [Ruegeria pomeroyi]QWV08303.1 aldo/keto reductase [Ruegeria pomeroyi]
MKTRPLGRTGIEVSALCLGTMTFGSQTSEADSHAQIDRALAAGITFVDTAEMYPVNPVSKETVGRSEEIIGSWNRANPARRGDYVLATKHSGAGMAHFRDGAPISGQTIAGAVEGSLKRLGTDHIDLYQFHWPNRGSYMFRQNWRYDPSGQDTGAVLENMADCLEALQREVDRGTIRAFGLSNESAWGTAQWLRLAESGQGPRVASMQNEYSLLCRLYDTDMAELSVNEDVGLMAFSPLAAGFLTGKYQRGAVPEGSRMSLVPEMGGRKSERVFDAVAAYLDIAQRHGIDPVHMALAWCQTRPFMMSAIFGATTLAQLDHVLAGADLTLSDEVLDEIARAHKAHPMPY